MELLAKEHSTVTVDGRINTLLNNYTHIYNKTGKKSIIYSMCITVILICSMLCFQFVFHKTSASVIKPDQQSTH